MATPPTGASIRFVSIIPGQGRGVLRIAVAVKTTPGEAEPFVLLRSGFASRVYLGAMIGAEGGVVELLEIAVQTLGGVAGSAATWRDYVSNAHLDRQWELAVQHAAQHAPDMHRQTGWEKQHPEPVFIDAERGEPVVPVDAGSNQPFRLCTDDALLKTAGLATYSDSLHRYWFARSPSDGAAITWVAATPYAPTNPGVRTPASVLPANRPLLPFNPEGGLLHVRRLAPVGFEDYVDFLAGRPWRGLASGTAWAKLAAPYANLGDWERIFQEPGNLFLHGRGRLGTVAETFYLRLQLIHQMLRRVADAVTVHRLPLLNLSAESFRIEMGLPTPGLPMLWSARACLVSPAQSVALPLSAGGLHHFLPLGVPATTIFRPDYLGLPVRGRGLVRLRRVSVDTSGQVAIEGTLVTSERLKLTPNDLVWVKLPAPGQVVDLFARLDTAEGMAVGESRFRTEPQRFDEATARQLKAAEGNAYDGTEYETIPMLSTPCDLYALGVLAVRALLVNAQNSLGVALDEVLSLARQMGAEQVEGDASVRVRSLVESDSRWLASLGPHRLWHEGVTPEAVMSVVPVELWWQTVAFVARLFPGQGPDSYCRDFADVSSFAIEKVFGQPLADLEKLLIQARGVLFCDWAANREVASVIARLRSG